MKTMYALALCIVHGAHGADSTPIPPGDAYIGVYDSFYYKLADTAALDDQQKNMLIKPALFVHLCVQASKATGIDKEPFNELVQKIRTRVIKVENNVCAMTKKDSDHRLLSYIPADKRPSLLVSSGAVLINGREAIMRFYCTGDRVEIVASGLLLDSDKQHHTKIMKEFTKLIRGAVT